MATNGVYGFYKNGEHKITYNHHDSYPSGLGQRILKYVKTNTIEDLNAYFTKIKIVNEKEVSSAKQINQCIPCINLNTDCEFTEDWCCLLREDQGDDLSAHSITDFMINLMTNSKDISWCSAYCEYAYIINLDTNKVEVYTKSQEPDIMMI